MRRHLHHLCSATALAAVLATGWCARAGAEEPGASPPQAPSSPGNPAPPPSPAQGPGAAAPAEGAAAPSPATPEQVAPIPPPVVPVPEVQQAPPTPDVVFSGKPVAPSEEEQARENSWFDAGHAYVGRLFFAPVVKLDRFFSDETDLDPERAQSFARLRGGIKVRQDGRPIWSGDLLAQLYTPGIEAWLDRFRLVLSGVSNTTEDNITAETTTTSPLSGRSPQPLNLELRFGAYHGIRNSLDLGAGILFQFPPGAFARIRYRLAIPVDDLLAFKLSSQLFYRTDMLFGTKLTGAVEWPVSPSSMIRLGGTSQVAERKTNGIEYGTELVFSHAFTPTSAVALGTEAIGNSRSPVDFDRYRVYTRFRHDVLRRWLFVEAEPEMAWPWTPVRGRYHALGITFRLEIQFEGAGAVAANP